MVSLRHKLLLFILPLCLTLLTGITAYSYYLAKERITQDRIVLYLEQIAVDIADTIQLTILEKEEETISMTLYSEFRNFLRGTDSHPPQLLLDQLLVVHEVYDVLALFDVNGTLLLCNSINRNQIREELDPDKLRSLRGERLVRYTPEDGWLQEVQSGHFGYVDWHASQLVEDLYGYQQEDVARQYSVGFAAPVMDERGVVLGGIFALMSWQYIQEILDKVELDLEERSITSGYAFLLDTDYNTVIGHKYRRNRNYQEVNSDDLTIARDNYGLRLVQDLKLAELHESVLQGDSYFRYQYPVGIRKISGLAPVDHEVFQWMCGVGINDEEIFAPVQDLLRKLIWMASLSAIGVVLLTYSVSRRITIPLNKLTLGASVIAAGDLSQRVEVSSRDEIGELAKTFNEMAQSLQERRQALHQLNKNLEDMVSERTRELEEKSRQVQQAYQELKETQVQLIQSEKMASLGQLVAGIAHEIKNPLNFIYGNTDFLREYVESLQRLIEVYEDQTRENPEVSSKVKSFKQEINYDFILQDLQTLIENFEEGADRIHAIIGDLKAFSRMGSEHFQSVDIHETLDLALNLLHNEYRDRINIHKEYSQLPRLECHPGKMNQVFMNLLANACQAIPEQGDIWVRTLAGDDHVVVEIEDNGPGIEDKHLGKVFEPFFTTKPVGEGTGLGLSISYGIIQQHNGTIEVESGEGKGAKFRVRLPLNH